VNKKSISQNLGHKFRLRPNPIVKKTKQPIKEDLNSWTLLDFPEEKQLVFSHNHSAYRLQVDAVYIRGHEPPDMIVFRGQFYLEDDLKFTFEPFTEGMSSADPRDLTADPFGKQSPRIFDALKPFEGQMVSIRFPKDDDGTEYGGHEAVLQEITPHYVKLHVPKLVINFPEWHKSIVGATPSFQPPNNKSDPVANQKVIPSYEKSIALDFLNLEEDVEKKRPRLVIDYSHWESRF
jgi:hypothetical protein